MEELARILTSHAERYPAMQPGDAVKLVYQNEFGGGHMIRDKDSCLAFLGREYADTEKTPGASLWTDIGNGLIRVELVALPEAQLEYLGAAFFASAQRHSGSLPRFLDKLAVLRRLTREKVFSFSAEELEAYLQDYAQAGYPPVSHSPRYRSAYRPAYRVVCREIFCGKDDRHLRLEENA